MEIIDIVDRNNRIIGTCERDEAHEKNLLHRSVGVFIFRDATLKEVALQKRAKWLKTAPGKWAAPAGHLPSGLSREEGARKEVLEEMFHGTTAELKFEELFTIYKDDDGDLELRTQFRTIHPGPFSIQPEEVEEWRWCSTNEVERLLKDSPETFSGTFRKVWKKYYSEAEDSS